jgi:hypothetical protein
VILNSKSLWTCPAHGNKRTSKTGGYDQSLHRPRNSPQDHFIKHSCGVTARRGNGPETTPILYLIERPECRREGTTDFHPLNCKTESAQSSSLLHMEGAYRPSNCLLMLMVPATVSIRWDSNAAACASVETCPANGMLGAGIAKGFGPDGRGSVFRQRKDILFFPHRPDQLLSPPILTYNGQREEFNSWDKVALGVKLTTQFRLVPRSRMVRLCQYSTHVFSVWCVIN